MESCFSVSEWNDDMAGRNTQISYLGQNNVNHTNDTTDSTSQAVGYTTGTSNLIFEVTKYRPLRPDDKDVKAERQQPTISDTLPKKRAKLSQPDSGTVLHSPTRSKGKQKKSLALLLEMPLDILFEIFSHLHPRDVINLTRTSKIFRETLLSRSAKTIWRAVCEREGAPECPSWLSEPAWVALLFEYVCQSCGAKNIRQIDFLLMKRVCLRCKKVHLVSLSGIFVRYPGSYGYNIFNLLPSTNISSWSHKYTRKRDFFWDTDVENMIRTLLVFKDDIERGLPNAQQLLDDFKDEQKRRVKYMKENFTRWNEWQTNRRPEKRMTCMWDTFLRELNSQIIPQVANLSPSPPNLPTDLSQFLTDDLDGFLFTQQESVDFERDIGSWFSSTGEIPLADVSTFKRDSGLWSNGQDSKESIPWANEGSYVCNPGLDRYLDDFLEADFNWYGSGV